MILSGRRYNKKRANPNKLPGQAPSSQAGRNPRGILPSIKYFSGFPVFYATS
jgi:hypothetical protein